MRIEFSLKSIGYNNFNEQMMISVYTVPEIFVLRQVLAGGLDGYSAGRRILNSAGLLMVVSIRSTLRWSYMLRPFDRLRDRRLSTSFDAVTF